MSRLVPKFLSGSLAKAHYAARSISCCALALESALSSRKFGIICTAAGFLSISGCGYWWASAYVTEPSASYWGITDRSQAELIKEKIAQFSDQQGFRKTMTIHAQLDARGSVFMADLEKRRARASITNVSNGCVLNVAFYNARFGGLSDDELAALSGQFVALISEIGIHLHERPMSVEDKFPDCEPQ